MSHLRRSGAALGAVLVLALGAQHAHAQDQGDKVPDKAGAPTPAFKPVPLAEAIKALTGDDAALAVVAARSLGVHKGPQALSSLLDGLAMGLAPEVASAALAALAAHRSIKSFDTLAAYRGHRSAKVRAAAVTALGGLDDSRAEKLILAALADSHVSVRAAAIQIAGERKLKKTAKELIALLKGGDEAAAPALAGLADPDLAKEVAELIGQAPDALVARCLGGILMRPDFKPEAARVEVVRALGKVPGDESVEHLAAYVASIPENPPRQSRREAEALIEVKLGGGK